MNPLRNLTLILLLHSSYMGMAEENRVAVAEGFDRIELLSETTAITPGVPFRLGMYFHLLPNYHTYWRGPGIVGVAPSFEWDLPEGFLIGETYWPAPKVVDMVGIKANGYHDKVLLITEITPPGTLEDNEVTIKVRSGWMACATSCHPGFGDFSINLPVAAPGLPGKPNLPASLVFEETLKMIPPAAPADWKWSLSRHDSAISLALEIPERSDGLEKGPIHFFCDDMQVNSDEPQSTEFPPPETRALIQQLPVPEFAPPNPEKLSGLLFNEKGWPGIDSHYVKVSIPWPSDKSDHE